jgi:MinD-like ATPase involved in chromosome partitioning or flagellar assembly
MWYHAGTTTARTERLLFARTDMTRIITLTGGAHDRTGTAVAAGLAERLAGSGQRVCLLALTDAAQAADGLPAADTVTLEDSLSGDRSFSLQPLAPGCDLVTGGRDAHWLRSLDDERVARLAGRLEDFGGYDCLIIDADAAADQNQLALALASPELLLTITPAAESLSSAYNLLKLLYAEQYSGTPGVLVTRCDDEAAGRHTYTKLCGIAAFYLEMPLPLAGIIGRQDPAVGLEKLSAGILQTGAGTPGMEIAEFSRRFLRAAGGLPEDDGATSLTPVFAPVPQDRDLHDQLALLSGQVDELIAEVERLRDSDAAVPPAPPQPASGRPAAVERCDSACIAAMASGSTPVTVAGETVTVYHLRQAGGRQLRFACQSIDDDLEEPEPQSRFS